MDLEYRCNAMTWKPCDSAEKAWRDPSSLTKYTLGRRGKSDSVRDVQQDTHMDDAELEKLMDGGGSSNSLSRVLTGGQMRVFRDGLMPDNWQRAAACLFQSV
jgi:hypothetical protein